MPDAKICILEKFKNIGGRLYTFHTTVNGLKVSWEAGAGRIHKSHHNVIKLLKEYNIDTIPITGGIEWRTPEGSKQIEFSKLLENLEVARIPQEDLEAKTLKNIFTEIMGIKKAQDFMNQYEYRSEIDTLKASKALESLSHELGHQEGFSVIKGGFSLLVDKLKESIPRVEILTEHEVTNIQQNKVLVKGKSPILASKVIVAIQRDAAVKLPCLTALPIMEQVKMRPLVRMYAAFPLQEGKAWFAGIQKFLCDLPIRYVIPIDPTKGTIMISYTDGPEAEYWMKQKNPQGQVMKQIRSLFPTIEIPDPLFFKVHPWADGCSYWTPYANGPYDFNKVSKASVKPLPDMPNLYMCNESWAYEQCWVKCSIDQAQKVIDLF
uniref:Tyrosinase copper-binding domain-containing protein n=1 Tax=viral metagenome TaxID=1070528 RepID=A0A6C0DJC9_9ZZZZ